MCQGIGDNSCLRTWQPGLPSPAPPGARCGRQLTGSSTYPGFPQDLVLTSGVRRGISLTFLPVRPDLRQRSHVRGTRRACVAIESAAINVYCEARRLCLRQAQTFTTAALPPFADPYRESAHLGALAKPGRAAVHNTDGSRYAKSARRAGRTLFSSQTYIGERSVKRASLSGLPLPFLQSRLIAFGLFPSTSLRISSGYANPFDRDPLFGSPTHYFAMRGFPR